MSALVDTSILIDHLRGRPQARSLLEGEALRGEPLFTSVLTKVEVLAGVRRSEERATSSLLDLMIWVEVTDAIAERAGTLANKFLRTHPGIDLVDYVVAATRSQLDVPLWTLNVRHFPMLPGLVPPY